MLRLTPPTSPCMGTVVFCNPSSSPVAVGAGGANFPFTDEKTEAQQGSTISAHA